MKPFPDTSNLVQRLNSVVKAASKTEHYRTADPPIPIEVTSLESFQAIPPTPILKYRDLRLPATLTDLSTIEWVVGPYLGHSPQAIAYVEDSDAARTRNDLYRHALGQAVTSGEKSSAVVIATHQRRYFGAEMASILVRIGIPAHLFVDLSLPRLEQVLQALEPSVLVVLDDEVIEEVIPASVNLCVTVRRSHTFTQHPQVDLYVVNELGLLGRSTDCATYSLNHAECHFEQNESGRLIVTPLYNLLQPKIRIETLDSVEFLNQTQARLTLAPNGG
ncbi:MAG: hypothetical protein IIC24_02905 [Chloroflexi bacterium]|nr:hypothetical protein [Chloroflexota bacterium]